MSLAKTIPEDECSAIVLAKEPQTFTCFPRLPLELRLKIWNQAINGIDGRIVRICHVDHTTTTFTDGMRIMQKEYITKYVITAGDPPALLYVNNESRKEALGNHYSLLPQARKVTWRVDGPSVKLGETLGNCLIPINFDKDTIFLTEQGRVEPSGNEHRPTSNRIFWFYNRWLKDFAANKDGICGTGGKSGLLQHLALCYHAVSSYWLLEDPIDGNIPLNDLLLKHPALRSLSFIDNNVDLENLINNADPSGYHLITRTPQSTDDFLQCDPYIDGNYRWIYRLVKNQMDEDPEANPLWQNGPGRLDEAKWNEFLDEQGQDRREKKGYKWPLLNVVKCVKNSQA